ncbi:MBL fold metallo-hydrolase [Streptosporangium sp. NPDC023615]|uniref:MBL fold metallo-hydrolase n=1 Tax=Streptosporangium sp. NPDC023615 TaxID=3154794 RepID=UPI0034156B17
MTDDFRLTVLGSATPYPGVDNPCSGYLVSCGGTRVWMDAGSGTLARLRRHVRLDELDAIWISHMHADHSADLLTAYYGALYADVRLTAPIPLYGPPGIADRLAHFLTNGPARSPIESAFAVRELHDGHRVRVGPLTLTSREVAHGMPAFAVRVEAGGASLVYSGDTALFAALVRGHVPATALRRSSRITSRQTPWWRPTRSRTPTTRNPSARCRERLGAFSGKIPPWIVQMPASSLAAMNAASSARPTPRP